jgi:leucyl-tRNA synthetase
MSEYNPQKIEPKWQKKWEELGLYEAEDFDKKPKQYILVEFPYPSADGLHVGQMRSYAAIDAVTRKKRMEGYNVLYPIGWDAFGLPTENYAIKVGINPQEATEKNTKNFKRQLKNLGLSFDWSREINTTDPKYYKWTQWIFLKLFEKGLAYQAKIPINWCPSCKIGLANEEVVAGKCERCGTEVERREQKQWMLKITDYADRLLEDLEKVDYSERIKTQQINWIGRSEGVTIKFKVQSSKFKVNDIEVFTTRLDTLFGVTALILAPEHELVGKITTKEHKKEVEDYIKAAKKKSELERTDLEKEKTGVFIGSSAINPANNEKIPIWIGDYVIATYGGGAVMIVPAHDKRDYQFAKKFGLEIREVISGGDISKEAFVDYGGLVNSGQFNGLKSEEAIEKITDWLEKKKLGRREIQYKLRDWVFSRQHYWGEPIPIIHCEKCGVIPVPEKDLPIELPYVKKYKPTETGESPLAIIKEWVNTKCPKCDGPAKRETDTMPNWAGSNWYFLRYCDPKNNKQLAAFKKLEYWMPIDLYNGGMEHTTLHLLYSRFWHKFLYDIKVVPTSEPYAKRRSHGMVLAADGRKMSKSFGNVINPDEVVEGYGADSLRLYEMFMGPYDQAINWNIEGLEGCYRFLKRVWALFGNGKKIGDKTNKEIVQKLHYTIKKVGDDLENMRFNTAVAAMMEFINAWNESVLSKDDAKKFLKILAPFCPHIAEELWDSKESIFQQGWPKYDEKLIRKETFELVIQVNGKVRDKVEVDAGISKKEAQKLALERERVQKWLGTKKPKKIIFVKGRLVNVVV